MPNKTAAAASSLFQEKKRTYVDALHVELSLSHRIQVGFFVTEFLLNASALQAAYPKSRSRSHMDQYFERRQASLVADVGTGHWKAACHQALCRDYLAGQLDWVISHYRTDATC